jgi:hypothetical protein
VRKTAKKEGLAARSLRVQLHKQGRGPTLLEHAVIKVGVVRGGEALWNLMMWTMARRKNGEEPTWQQFGEVALLQRAAAYTALGLLRTVYGDGLAEAADAVEAAAGEQIDALLAIHSGKDVRVAMGVIGPVLAPVGLAL